MFAVASLLAGLAQSDLMRAPPSNGDPVTRIFRKPVNTAGFPFGKALISLVGTSAAVGAFAADWNETHIYNPTWPPHAKFHNAQTMTFAVELAALSLNQLWAGDRDDRTRLRWGTLLGGLFWLAQAPAILFPGTAFADPDQEDKQPVVFGVKVNQVIGQVAVIYPILGLGYALESRRLRRIGSNR